MKIELRRWFVQADHKLIEDGRAGDPPLCRVAAVAVVENPYAGRRVDDLRPLIDASAALGAFLAEKAIAAIKPYRAESYGKGGVVGLGGEQEHANALITTTFAEPLRRAVGGGKAWISSFTKRSASGGTVDIPLAHKDALYVRSHYDGMTVVLPESPMPDEIAVILCLANRGRIGARVGGLEAKDISAFDGLR